MIKHLSRILQLFSCDLKLSILFNQAEHPKGLTLFDIYTTPFYINYNYFTRVFYKKNINFYFKLKSPDELSIKPQKLIIIYKKNLYYT